MGHGQPPRPRTVPRLNNKTGLIGMVHAPLRPAVGARPRDGLFRRLQRQLPGAHRGGDGPADNSSVCFSKLASAL